MTILGHGKRKLWFLENSSQIYQFGIISVRKTPQKANLKGVLHTWLKIKMFCVLSQSYQHFFWKKIMHESESKLYKELKKGIEILVGQLVFKLQSK